MANAGSPCDSALILLRMDERPSPLCWKMFERHPKSQKDTSDNLSSVCRRLIPGNRLLRNPYVAW